MAELIPTRELMARQTADAILKNSGELTDDQKKALRAGTARAWYADLPGAAADLAGSALDYGAEGLARLLPSDLAGYDLPKSLGIRGFQRAMRDPAGGSKQLEQLGEDIGYIPPSTGTQEEEMARLFMGLADPVPLPAGMMQKVFTSPAVKAVSEIKQNKMPANQWISQMKSRGVKQDELTWTGVEDWLKSQKGSVTKQDLDEYLEANQIQVQEVVKGTADPKAKELVINNEIADELTSIMDNDQELYLIREEITPYLEKYRSGDETVVNDLNEIFDSYQDLDTGELAIPMLRSKWNTYFERNPREFERLAGGETQYSQYTLPGGENYRELLLTLPSKRTIDPEKRYEELMRIVDRRAPTEAESFEMEALENQMMGRSGSVGRDFISGHYKEPNIVAHIRFNERVDADGNKVLFIEEIQSDWAQAGRKKGFSPADRDIDQEITDINKELSQVSQVIDTLDSQYRNAEIDVFERNERYLPLKEEYEALLDKRSELVEQIKAVPSAPFVMDTNQWTSLALKRMVRWASDNDFDQIAWTTGKQQAKRYDLSKQVNEVSAMKNKDGTYQLAAEDKRGFDIFGYAGKKVTAEEMADNIGKEVAEKLIKGADSVEGAPWPSGKGHNPAFFRLFPEDLEIGGEGMGAFYDKILVDRAKKLGKQYGSKVKEGFIGLPKTSRFEVEETPEGFDVVDTVNLEEVELGFLTREAAEETADGLNQQIMDTQGLVDADDIDQDGFKVWTMDLTDKLKKAAKDGLPYYVALPPIAAGVQRESERQQINQIQAQQNAQRINAQ